MKSVQSLLLAALVSMFALTSCSESATKTETTTDTTATEQSSAAADASQGIEANKTLVKDYYQALYGDKDSSAIDKYIADDIKQHNPILPADGKAAMKDLVRAYLAIPNLPKTKVDIEQISAEGDLVWILVKDTAPNGKVFARVEIFRVTNGKISENWKVAEKVDGASENKNGPF